ncbi:MAG: hypothetical protein AB8H12_07940 [Lewinella sp.]
MRKFLYLLPFLAFFACTKDNFEPKEEKETLYYLLIKAEIGEDLNPLKVGAIACLRPYGNFRINNVYLGTSNKQPLLIVRRFNNERTGKRLVKALRNEPIFRKQEMKIISQMNYREMLKQRTFYAVY